MSKLEETLAEAIYDMIMSQDFADWYEQKFNDHVENDPSSSTGKAEILKDIIDLFSPAGYVFTEIIDCVNE